PSSPISCRRAAKCLQRVLYLHSHLARVPAATRFAQIDRRLPTPRQTPGCHVRQSLHFCQLDAPVAANIDLGDRATPALRFIETRQAFREGLARQYLQFGVEGGSNGKTAFIKFLLTVALVEI